jgi:hypothetical protein
MMLSSPLDLKDKKGKAQPMARNISPEMAKDCNFRKESFLTRVRKSPHLEQLAFSPWRMPLTSYNRSQEGQAIRPESADAGNGISLGLGQIHARHYIHGGRPL